MTHLSVDAMRAYLARSISSFNENKLRGVLAEVAFRAYLTSLGFGNRVSVGGWLARSTGAGQFAMRTVVVFPEIVSPGTGYPVGRLLPPPPNGLHGICAVFQQIGVESYYCQPSIALVDDPMSVSWSATRLGIPGAAPQLPLAGALTALTPRRSRYNFLRHAQDMSSLPAFAVPDEFSKEHLRVSTQAPFIAECSDVDGVLWGQQHVYPIEVKEKTVAKEDRRVGEYFGIDLGPFVKLAFYAAKRGNLRSLFVVREIDDPATRNLVSWWYVTFETLAQFASWQKQGGGADMGGGASTVVKIPKTAFSQLDAAALAQL